MKDYKTPGVYVEEKTVLPGSVAGVSTAVPAFIGYTEKAGVNGDLVNKPTKIRTLKEYEELFGTAPEEAIEVTVDGTLTEIISCRLPELSKLMYYSMQMFFDNGGESCYIVSIDSNMDDGESAKFQAALNALKIEDEPTLVVVPDGTRLDSADYYSFCEKVLAHCDEMKDRFAVIDVKESGAGADTDAAEFRNGFGKENLKYGAAYYPYVNTSLKYEYSDDSVAVKVSVDDVLVEYKLGDAEIKEKQTGLYNKIKKAIESHTVTLPPGSAVAGVYASVDRERGVWKAPANVSLASVVEPSLKLTESENDGLNVDPESGKSINAIRSFTGKGTLIWGARTLAGNDNEWRYVPVRRLFNYVEESIRKATAFAVFEPNTAMTWLKLRSMVEGFLDSLWRQGALAGGKADDAYFVQAGLGTTMTAQDIQEGRLIIKVGLAASRPAEFIVLEFTHKLQE